MKSREQRRKEKALKKFEYHLKNLRDTVKYEENKNTRKFFVFLLVEFFNKYKDYTFENFIKTLVADALTTEEQNNILSLFADLGEYRDTFEKKSKTIILFSNAVFIIENETKTLFFYDEITRYNKEIIEKRGNGIYLGIIHRFIFSEENSIYDYYLEFFETTEDEHFITIFDTDVTNRKTSTKKRFENEKVEDSFLFRNY